MAMDERTFDGPDRLIDGDAALQWRRVGWSGDHLAPVNCPKGPVREIIREDLHLLLSSQRAQNAHRRVCGGSAADDIVDVGGRL